MLPSREYQPNSRKAHQHSLLFHDETPHCSVSLWTTSRDDGDQPLWGGSQHQIRCRQGSLLFPDDIDYDINARAQFIEEENLDRDIDADIMTTEDNPSQGQDVNVLPIIVINDDNNQEDEDENLCQGRYESIDRTLLSPISYLEILPTKNRPSYQSFQLP